MFQEIIFPCTTSIKYADFTKLEFCFEGVGDVIFNPRSGVGQLILSHAEEVGHICFANGAFPNAPAHPHPILSDHSLK